MIFATVLLLQLAFTAGMQSGLQPDALPHAPPTQSLGHRLQQQAPEGCAQGCIQQIRDKAYRHGIAPTDGVGIAAASAAVGVGAASGSACLVGAGMFLGGMVCGGRVTQRQNIRTETAARLLQGRPRSVIEEAITDAREYIEDQAAREQKK